MRSLYRRYRPLKLADVVGENQVSEPLANAIKDGKISHAYLFTGPRGTGKTSVARIFAHEINGFNYELEDEYVDIIEIDGASNRGIDDIREIREKAMIKPTLGKYKVYIIDEVHMLTREAFNALLKTLEEPPEHVIFLMATTDPQKVPVTILSRAQTYTFKLVDEETVFGHLSDIAKKEKIDIEPDALRVVVKRGGGSFRDSLSLLDQISTVDTGKITKEMVEKMMGLPQDEKIRDILTAYSSGDVVKITTLLKEFYTTGVKAEIVAEELIKAIIDTPDATLLPLLGKLPEVKAPFADARLLYILAAPQTAQSAPSSQAAPAARATTYTAPAARPQTVSSPAPTQPAQSFQKPAGTSKLMAKLAEAKKPKTSPQNSQISAIMGGEVQEYGGGSPF